MIIYLIASVPAELRAGYFNEEGGQAGYRTTTNILDPSSQGGAIRNQALSSHSSTRGTR